jgi:molybdopterin molybdotransferase
MIDFNKAFEISQSHALQPKKSVVSFLNSRGYILAENVYSDISMPPFNKSAMDGYACRFEDLQNDLEVLEIIPAGASPKYKIGKNQCSKIMTGGMVPEGADTVIMVENVEKVDANHIHLNQTQTSRNICYFGEDVKKGDKVLSMGDYLTSRHIPVLASVGKTEVAVFEKPKVGILVTGDELKEPGEPLELAEIRNSNAYTLISLLEEMQIEPNYYGILKDRVEVAQNVFQNALNECDILILTGAVSMGDFDFVPQMLKNNEFQIHFHGINVKPGKRLIFGTKKNKVVFGLPGNPVSTFAQFLFLVKPFILKSSGGNAEVKYYHFRIENDFQRKSSEKTEFVPVKINGNSFVIVTEYHGSAHFNALSISHGFMKIPTGINKINAGSTVQVYLF